MDSAHIPIISGVIEKLINEAMKEARNEALDEAAAIVASCFNRPNENAARAYGMILVLRNHPDLLTP